MMNKSFLRALGCSVAMILGIVVPWLGGEFANAAPAQAASLSRASRANLRPSPWQLLERKDSGSVPLRGFGTVEAEGTVWKGATGTVSLVRFLAESEASAKIVGSKYLADFISYGLVQEMNAGDWTGGAVYTVKDGGIWVIGIQGKEVRVLSGANLDILRPAAQALQSVRWTKPDVTGYPAYLGFFDQSSLGQWWMPGLKSKEVMDFFRDHPSIVNANADRFSQSYAPKVYDTSGASNVVAQSRELGKPYRMMFWAGLADWWDGANDKDNIEEPPPHALLRTLFESSGYFVTQMVSPAAQAIHLDTMAQFMKRFVDDPSLLGWLEPDGEFYLHPVRGVPPNAKARFPKYLRKVKGYTLAKLNDAYGLKLAKVEDIPYPETADFFGRRGQVLDLDDQPWRWQPGETLDSGMLKKWNEPTFDDSAWTQDVRWSKRMLSQAPLHGSSVSPIWYRFTAQVPAAFLKSSPRRLLHVMPMSENAGRQLALWVNGKEVKEDPYFSTSHIKTHAQFDVTELLKEGPNQIALFNNGGHIAYRVFVSDTESEVFPFKDPKLSQLWIDWSDYLIWEKYKTLETTLRWMRAIDPVRPIKVMTPFLFQSQSMDLFEKYGAYPQLTGEVAGFYRPMHYKGYSRLRGLPGSSEPGSYCKDARQAQGMFANIFWESQDCHDYVFDPARDMWPFKDVVQWWKENIPLMKTLGKIDFAQAQVGVLRDMEQEFRYANGKIMLWDLSRGPLPSAGVTPVLVDGRDFDLGLADKVPVIFDCATIVMTPERVRSIQRYIENGGIFIAQHHTGRSTPLVADQWPLAKAFDLQIKDRLTTEDKPQTWPIAPIRFTAEETLLPSLRGKKTEGTGVSIDWQGNANSGAISIQANRKDVTPIAHWEDGTMAVCEIKRGKGRLIWLGSPFHLRFKDESGKFLNDESRQALLTEMLESLGVTISAVSSDKRVWIEKRESKNGLYDVYLACAMNIRGKDWKLEDRIASDLTLHGVGSQSVVFDPTQQGSPEIANERNGKALVLKNQTFKPYQVRQFSVVRPDAGIAGPLHWLAVQHGQWRALKDPQIGTLDELSKAAAQQAALAREDGLDLSADWKVRLSDDPKASPNTDWAAPEYRDDSWQLGQLGSWLVNGWQQAGAVQYRKKVTLPAAWISPKKRVLIGFNGFHLLGIRDSATLWVNGTPLTGKLQNGTLLDIGTAAQSGTLQLALEVVGSSRDKGPGGVLYLRCVDQPSETVELAGPWDRLTGWHITDGNVTVPGPLAGTYGLRRKFTVPAAWAHKRVRLVIETDTPFGVTGVFINEGGYVRQDRQSYFPYGIRIDGWLKPGDNIVELYGNGHQNRQKYKGLSGDLKNVRLEIYD